MKYGQSLPKEIIVKKTRSDLVPLREGIAFKIRFIVMLLL